MSARFPIHERPVRPLSPDALVALQQAVKQYGTQVAVAEELGISAAAVNQCLHNKYRGDTASIELRIRGALMKVNVQCPVLGQLSTKDCLDNQTRKVTFTNPLRVRLAKACASCPNRRDPGASK